MEKNGHNRRLRLFALAYALLAFILLLGYIPGHDTLYYWDWSRHLATGYHDGPLVIAYYWKLFTSVFGHSETAIVLTGIISNLILALVIYLLTNTLFGDKKMASLAAVIWLFTPIIFFIYTLQVTYDTPACLFSLLTLYFFYLYHQKKTPHYIYFSALAGCLMLLSKYTGVAFLLSLLVLMVVSKNYRYLLKDKHVYWALTLFISIFCAVLLWNRFHDVPNAISFQAQHALSAITKRSLSLVLFYVALDLLIFNVPLILFFVFIKKYAYQKKMTDVVELLIYPAITIYLFFFAVSFSRFAINWNILFYNTVPIAVAYLVQSQAFFRRLLWVSLTLFAMALFVLAFLIADFGPNYLAKQNANLNEKRLALELGAYIKPCDVVFSNNYRLNALIDFYLKGVHVYSRNGQGNQYRYWSEKQNGLLKEKKIPSFIYLTENQSTFNIPGYQCQWLFKAKHALTNGVVFAPATWQIALYRCTTALQKNLKSHGT